MRRQVKGKQNLPSTNYILYARTSIKKPDRFGKKINITRKKYIKYLENENDKLIEEIRPLRSHVLNMNSISTSSHNMDIKCESCENFEIKIEDLHILSKFNKYKDKIYLILCNCCVSNKYRFYNYRIHIDKFMTIFYLKKYKDFLFVLM